MFIYSADRSYLPITCLSIASLARFASTKPEVLLLVHDLTPQHYERIAGFFASINANVQIANIDPAPFTPVCESRRQSPAKFAPLQWQRYLTRIPERLIYVDSDTRIVADTDALFAMDLGDAPLAAVHDSAVISDDRVRRLCRKLSIPEDAGYFNSGLLVIDTAAWLREDIGERALQILDKEQHVLTWNDQCALNKVLAGNWKPLPFAWNKIAGSAPSEWPERMVHFAGTYKPWTVGILSHLRLMDQLVGRKHIDWYARTAPQMNWPGFYNGWQQTRTSAWSMTALFGEHLSGHLRDHLARPSSPHLKRFVADHPELVQ